MFLNVEGSVVGRDSFTTKAGVTYFSITFSLKSGQLVTLNCNADCHAQAGGLLLKSGVYHCALEAHNFQGKSSLEVVGVNPAK